MRPGVSPQQRHERVEVIAAQERGGQAQRKPDSKRVPITPGVLGGDETPLSGMAEVEHSTLAHERRDPVAYRRGLRAASRNLLGGEVAQAKEHLVDTVGMTGSTLAGEVLKRELEIGHRVLVEELAKLHFAEERAELRWIHGQRLGAKLGERCVALVH